MSHHMLCMVRIAFTQDMSGMPCRFMKHTRGRACHAYHSTLRVITRGVHAIHITRPPCCRMVSVSILLTHACMFDVVVVVVNGLHQQRSRGRPCRASGCRPRPRARWSSPKRTRPLLRPPAWRGSRRGCSRSRNCLRRGRRRWARARGRLRRPAPARIEQGSWRRSVVLK